MHLTVEIPDDLIGPLSVSGGDLARRALEAFALEEYKSGRLTEDELRRLLGFGTRYLLLIGHVEILPAMFEKVILPSAVKDELAHPDTPLSVVPERRGRVHAGGPPSRGLGSQNDGCGTKCPGVIRL